MRALQKNPAWDHHFPAQSSFALDLLPVLLFCLNHIGMTVCKVLRDYYYYIVLPVPDSIDPYVFTNYSNSKYAS